MSLLSPTSIERRHQLQSLQAESFLCLLSGEDWYRQQPIFFEHGGNRAIRLDNLKLVKMYGHDWERYTMDTGRTEFSNIAGRNAPLEEGLLKRCQDWVDKNVSLIRASLCQGCSRLGRSGARWDDGLRLLAD